MLGLNGGGQVKLPYITLGLSRLQVFHFVVGAPVLCQYGAMARLFVSDLDGTLVGKSGRISAWSSRNLCSMLGDGLLFTVATARSIESLSPLIAGLPLSLPVIELNGALLTDLGTRTSAYCEVLDPQIARAIEARAALLGLAPFLSTYHQGQQRLYPPQQEGNEGMLWYFNERKQAADKRLQARCHAPTVLHQPLVCLTLISRKPELLTLKRGIEADFAGQTNSLIYPNPYQPGWHWLTVQSARADKAHAIGRLIESLGIGWQDVTVFGDEVNDLAMFGAAGCGVAVDNAVSELKTCAKRVIGANSTDSVVRYIMDHHTA